MKKLKRATKSSKFEWKKAPDVKIRLRKLIKTLDIDYIKPNSIHTYRSANSKTRAYARIWGLSKLWQEVLEVRPTYIIEVLSQHFDDLPEKEKDKVILHELTHIPKNFSGALVAHTHRKKGSFHDKLEKLYESYHSSR
ncbi:MAG TPA: putative metallopeptidase [Alphaproteobacteria bacterium]|jgi:predicted metallopeptidase|nr:putative metallopeptidase [Alphaproteobacteria bacterium]